MINVADRVKLTPKTRRGKNALQNKGDTWVVIRLGFFNNSGAMLLQEYGTVNLRWVKLSQDENFDWVKTN